VNLRRLAAAAVAALVMATAAPARAEAPFDFATTPGILRKDVVPLEYDLHLRPDLGTRTSRGTQTITLEVAPLARARDDRRQSLTLRMRRPSPVADAARAMRPATWAVR